ncbi:MAG: acylneuraminate cytidylyltransferase family protein [Proteobacteria bacterium]|nr:acylneuraminate cytidylyltransferase family protein [Bacteroidota bacterium]MBU1711803.1 acylneuraminate cytidylyltransferase family protein [Pseudomonadota bacterium]
MKTLAIIPARGGSKRVPRKNVIDFFGNPLIDYTIRAAIESKKLDDIVVSSEDEEVIAVSSRYKEIEIIRRPDHLSTDHASVMDVANHVLGIKNINNQYDYIFIMLASTPLRSSDDVINIYNILEEKRPNGVVSVTEFPFPVIYALNLDDNGSLKRSFPEMADRKTQFSPKYYVDNGGIYALKPEFIYKKNYFPPDTHPYIMPFWASIDVDTPEDLNTAKAMYSYYFKKNA